MFGRKKQMTKLPNGKKPKYSDLEQSFLITYKKMIEANQEVHRLTLLNAELRYDLENLKDK